MGVTAASRFLEMKSQKTLGQMKPSMALAIWSVEYGLLAVEVVVMECYAVRTG